MKRGRKKVKRGRKIRKKEKGGGKQEKGGRIVSLKSGEGFQDAGKGDGKYFKLGWGICTPAFNTYLFFILKSLQNGQDLFILY